MALTVEFGEAIDPASEAAVHRLDHWLMAHPPAGLIETVPTYRSLMIHYNPLILPREALIAAVTLGLESASAAASVGRLWQVPACYDPSLAEDLAFVADALGSTTAKIAALHAGAEYRLAMVGFAPGWAYLSGLPKELAIARRASPRPRIPANSLIIAGGLAIIATMPMPSGWHILGRTPERLFDVKREPPFLLQVGDRIRFEPVDLAGFMSLEQRSASGEIIARLLA